MSKEKITGKLMFKFDDDKPIVLMEMQKGQEFHIALKQEKGQSITFQDNKGKKMELYVALMVN